MMHLNPLVLVGAVIGVITALLVAAYAAVKDKKTAMGFERNMEDGEIMRRLARSATSSLWHTSSSTRSPWASWSPV